MSFQQTKLWIMVVFPAVQNKQSLCCMKYPKLTVRRLYFGTLDGRFMFSLTFRKLSLDFNLEQDGPSLESSSYLNVTLRYQGPQDLGTIGPWDSQTSSLLILPITSSYLLLSPPIFPPTLLLWYGLVWGGVLSCDIGD